MKLGLEAQDAEEQQVWPEALRRMGRGLLRVPRRFAWLPALAWAGLIFALSSHHAPLGKLPGNFPISLLGNAAHAFEFGVLLLLLVPFLPRSSNWVIWTPFSSCVLSVLVFLYAVTDEVHQSRVPGRDASLLDLCTDLAGILCVYWVVRRLENERLTSKELKVILGRAVVLCLACAAAATVWGRIWLDGPWPFPA